VKIRENPTLTTSTSADAHDTGPKHHVIARLRDGTQIRVRHVTRRDGPALLRFMERLTPESRQMRFSSPACDVDAAAKWAASADGTDHIGILAVDESDRILGHAACVRMYGPRAEVAIEVGETHRHQGLATILISKLAREAEEKQIRHFVAEVLPQNHEMLDVFHDGFDADWQSAGGEVDIEFPTSAWQLPSDRFGQPQPDTPD
jgi:GNAT superfamily N-acetyltransferase